MIEEMVSLEPCHPGCTKRCSRNRRALRALLVSIGILAGCRGEAPPAPDASSVQWRDYHAADLGVALRVPSSFDFDEQGPEVAFRSEEGPTAIRLVWVTEEDADRVRELHAVAFDRRSSQVRPLPGARELLAHLSDRGVPYAIATSGRLRTAGPNLEMLGLAPDIPVVTRDQVRYAKPDPDLFLAAAERLGVPIGSSIVVGDSVWDLLAAQRARALGVGLLSGGYGEDELNRAGAYRVYQDPADLLDHLDEVGVRGVL